VANPDFSNISGKKRGLFFINKKLIYFLLFVFSISTQVYRQMTLLWLLILSRTYPSIRFKYHRHGFSLKLIWLTMKDAQSLKGNNNSNIY